MMLIQHKLSAKVVATVLVFIIVRHQILHWFVYPMKESPDEKTQALEPLARTGVNIVIATVLGSYVLGQLGISVAPILSAAFAMLWIFGKYFDDILGGFVVLMQNRFDVGDEIQIDGPFGLKGEVVTLGYRGTTIKDEEGKLWTIRNADLYDRIGVIDKEVEKSTKTQQANGFVLVPGVGWVPESRLPSTTASGLPTNGDSTATSTTPSTSTSSTTSTSPATSTTSPAP